MSKRRRFQAPLTSFFSKSSKHTLDHSNPESSQHESTSPSSQTSLDSSVQSSLLTVGMRIRKSVPEGYKTQIAASQNSSRALHEPSFFVGSEGTNAAGSSSSNAQSRHSTDLTPYCGLHKVGGLGVQAFPSPTKMSAFSFPQVNSPDELLSLPSSQESAYPSSTNFSTRSSRDPRKRSQVFDDDCDGENVHGASSEAADAFSLTTSSTMYPYSHTCMPDLTAFSSPTVTMRTIVQPKSRTRKRAGADSKDLVDPGPKNSQNAFGFLGDFHFDFGEATFLKPREDVEMDGY